MQLVMSVYWSRRACSVRFASAGCFEQSIDANLLHRSADCFNEPLLEAFAQRNLEVGVYDGEISLYDRDDPSKKLLRKLEIRHIKFDGVGVDAAPAPKPEATWCVARVARDGADRYCAKPATTVVTNARGGTWPCCTACVINQSVRPGRRRPITVGDTMESCWTDGTLSDIAAVRARALQNEKAAAQAMASLSPPAPPTDLYQQGVGPMVAAVGAAVDIARVAELERANKELLYQSGAFDRLQAEHQRVRGELAKAKDEAFTTRAALEQLKLEREDLQRRLAAAEAETTKPKGHRFRCFAVAGCQARATWFAPGRYRGTSCDEHKATAEAPDAEAPRGYELLPMPANAGFGGELVIPWDNQVEALERLLRMMGEEVGDDPTPPVGDQWGVRAPGLLDRYGFFI